MAGILYDMKEQRDELKRRLKDFDTLENELYPEIKEVVEDLGYDCNVSLNLSSHMYGTFRIGAYKNNRAVAYIDVAFPTRASAGDYVVTQLDSRGLSKIRREVVAPEDLIDIIESYLADIPEMESKAEEFREGRYYTNRIKSLVAQDVVTMADIGEYALDAFSEDDIEKLHNWLVEDEIIPSEEELPYESRKPEAVVSAEDCTGTVNAAFDEVAPKLFKIELEELNPEPDAAGVIDIYAKYPNGAPVDISWRILPDEGVLAQYADDFRGGSTVERELRFNDRAKLKEILIDEFESLEETLGYAP